MQMVLQKRSIELKDATWTDQLGTAGKFHIPSYVKEPSKLPLKGKEASIIIWKM